MGPKQYTMYLFAADSAMSLQLLLWLCVEHCRIWDVEFNIPHTCTNRKQRQSGKIRGRELIQWILYADDIVLFCKAVSEAEQLPNITNGTWNNILKKYQKPSV